MPLQSAVASSSCPESHAPLEVMEVRRYDLFDLLPKLLLMGDVAVYMRASVQVVQVER
jgi:hypothetical protein